MSELSAAENIVIDIEPGTWRLLLRDEDGNREMLLTAATGQPLTYSSQFARTRRMPNTLSLSTTYIRQVVLGWSHEDECWHLGLLLVTGLADARGSRWCELALWPDPDQNVFVDLARQAGESLSQTIGIPFSYIEPRTRPAAAPEAPPPPLPALPLQTGMWTLEAVEQEGRELLQFRRSINWLTARLLRLSWYSVLTVAYVLLSLTTLNTDLALPNAGTMLPNPELLPYLGLVIAVILIFSVLYILYEIFTHPNRIVVDGEAQQVMALRGSSPRWQHTLDDVQSVYVTQVVNRRGKKRTVYHGELNLHLGETDFRRLVKQDEHDEDHLPPPEERPTDEIIPLTARNIETDLQAAGVYIAEHLGNLTCWYDQRTR